VKSNKNAIIIGGSSGIGREFAKYFLESGFNVVIISKNKEHLETAKMYLAKFKTNGANLEAICGNVTDSSIDTAINNAYDLMKTDYIDYVVYTAGISIPGKFGEIPIEKFALSMDVNYFGFLRVVRRVLSKKMKMHTKIIVISSMAALIDTFGYTTYAPSKIALRSLVKGLSYEANNVSFYIIYPIDTLTKQLIEENAVKPLETFLIDKAGGLTTTKKIVSYTMKIAEKESKKNFYEIIPEGRLSYLVAKLFPWIIDMVVENAKKKAKKIKEDGKEKETLDEMIKTYKDKFENINRN